MWFDLDHAISRQLFNGVGFTLQGFRSLSQVLINLDSIQKDRLTLLDNTD